LEQRLWDGDADVRCVIPIYLTQARVSGKAGGRGGRLILRVFNCRAGWLRKRVGIHDEAEGDWRAFLAHKDEILSDVLGVECGS